MVECASGGCGLESWRVSVLGWRALLNSKVSWVVVRMLLSFELNARDCKK